MARSCTVCTSADLESIDQELVSKTALPAIAGRFGLGIDALRRHKKNHLTPAMAQVALRRRSEGSAETAQDRFERLLTEAYEFLDMARARSNIMGGATVLRELRQTLETIARLSGELDDRPSLTVNVLATPEARQLLTVFMELVDPYPELAIRAAERFQAIGVEALES